MPLLICTGSPGVQGSALIAALTAETTPFLRVAIG
jgi:hypothetical protein